VHIHDYIKFQVDTAGSNFSKWRQILTLLITMYKVVDHITEGVAPSAPSDDWQAVDIHLSLWFMATLTDDLYRLVQGADGRACSTWTRLHRFFLNNGTKRYAFLSKAFRTTSRGDMPVSVYASKLQGIADDLAAIGRPVSDVDLTTQFIDGIGKKFKLEAAILKGPEALPSFANACSHFQLAEIDADAEQADAGAHAYAVHGAGRGAPTGSGVHTSGGHTNQPRMPGVSPNYRGKNPIPGYRPATQQPQHYGDGGRGRGMAGGRGTGDHSNSRGGNQHPWYGVFAPVGMSLPVGAPPPARASWVPPNFSGVLGSRPGAPTQAYPVMQSPAPSAPAAPSAPSYQLQYPSPAYQTQSWDHNTMLQHAPSYGSAFPAYGGDWIMDSGATSHVTGTQGNLTTSHSPFELKSHHIIVGNGKRLPVVATGTTQLTPTSFSLNNVLVSLISSPTSSALAHSFVITSAPLNLIHLASL
jgi:hypothetical protein